MSRRAVRGYLRRERCPDWRPGRATRSRMDEHREWIDARVAEGRINASELHHELAAREFDSRTPRSVAISPSVWDGPARRVPG